MAGVLFVFPVMFCWKKHAPYAALLLEEPGKGRGRRRKGDEVTWVSSGLLVWGFCLEGLNKSCFATDRMKVVV